MAIEENESSKEGEAKEDKIPMIEEFDADNFTQIAFIAKLGEE